LFKVSALSSFLVALWVVGLVADALGAAVRTDPLGVFHDLLDRVGLGVVDRDRPDLLGKAQPVGVAIDDHHLGRAHHPAERAAIRPTGPPP
jgi:hypothetical protein